MPNYCPKVYRIYAVIFVGRTLYYPLKDRLVTVELRLDDKDTCTNAITADTPQSS